MKRAIGILFIAVTLVAAGAGARHFLQDERDVTTKSAEAYEMYQQGLAEARRIRRPQGMELLRKAIEADPEFAMAHLELGHLAFREQQREFAMKCIENAYALREAVTEVEQLQIERTYAALKEDSDTVQRTLEDLIAKYPSHPSTCYIRASEAKRRGDYKEALTCFNEILEQDPERIDIYNEVGYLYLQAGDYEEGISHLRRYAFFAPDLANPHDSLGEAYFHTGRYEESIEEYSAALRIDPTFANSASFLARVFSMTGRFQAAGDILDTTRSVFEERGWMNMWHWSRLIVDARAKNWDEVLARLDTIESLSSKGDMMHDEALIGVTYYRAVALLELGRTEEATTVALTIDALVEKAMGDEKDLDDRTADNVQLRRAYLMSRFARATDSPLDGIEGLREALAQSPRSPHELAEYRHELAQALYDAGEYEQAISEGDRLLSAIPTFPRTNLLLAKAHLKERRPREAMRYLTTFVDVMQYADEDNPDVIEARELLKRVVPSG